MKKLSLQLRITILSAIVLIAITVILTIIAVKNAQQTYTSQFEMNFGEDFSIRFNDNEITFDGTGGDLLTDIFGFIEGISGNEGNKAETAKGMFSEAGKEFAQKSLGVMIIFVMIGIILNYFVVRKALTPVRNLSQITKEINENNLYQKIEVPPTKDEISSLSCSFNEMLERLNQSFTMQKNFAANAAHELRTPLSTMKAAVQVLEMDEEPPIEDYKDTIDVVKKSTQKMIQVVDDLLKLSKNEQCDFTHYIHIPQLFEEIKAELAEKAKTMNVAIVLGNCEGRVKGNETLIYRALFNLVENAVKYNRSGGSVFISCGRKNEFTRITIRDDGIGMEKEALGHIFEPFYRVDKARSKMVGGSGLGLTIVKDIIEKHQGHISVESTEGEGTTFTIELP